MKRISTITVALLFLGGALLALPPVAAAPTVTSHIDNNPDPGPASERHSDDTNGGDELTITGTGFEADTTVTIGGTAATVLSRTGSTGIVAKIPPHAAGTVNIVVRHPSDGTQETITNGYTYFAASAPVIDSISPNSGSTNGGFTATIDGDGFHPGSIVRIGGVLAVPASALSDDPDEADTTNDGRAGSVADNSFSITVPANTAGALTLSIVNPDGQSASLASAMTQVAPAAPSITSIVPNTGDSHGAAGILVSGHNFVAGAVVHFAGKPATVTGFIDNIAPTPDVLTVTAPANVPGAANVQVTNPDAQNAISPGGFFYTPHAAIGGPPALTEAAGPATGGTLLEIGGTDFHSDVAVTFGGLPAKILSVAGGTTITLNTPAHAVGLVNVVITNPDGSTTTLTDAFTYVDHFSVFSVTPKEVGTNGGETVTLTGRNLDSGVRLFADIGPAPLVELALITANGNTLTFKAPPAPVGTGWDVIFWLFDSEGRAHRLVYPYEYVDATAPAITSLSALTGPENGGNILTVNGNNFAPGARVFFDDGVCDVPPVADLDDVVPGLEICEGDVTSITATKITARVPGDDDALADGAGHTVSVRVYNPDAQLSADTAMDDYTYANEAAPTIPTTSSGISPHIVPEWGGASLVINGGGFKTGAATATPVAVEIDGVPVPTASITVNSAIKITVITPLLPPAIDVEVKVINPGGDSVAYAPGVPADELDIEDNAAPTLIGLSIGSAPSHGGTPITLTGTGFATSNTATDPVVVTVGGAPLLDVSVTKTGVDAGKKITAKLPGRATGTGLPVVVTNPGGDATVGGPTLDIVTGSAPIVSSINRAGTNLDETGVVITVIGVNLGLQNDVPLGTPPTVTLRKTDAPTTVQTADTVVVDNGGQLRATFLTIAPTPGLNVGVYDIVVTNQDGQTGELEDALAILGAGPERATTSAASRTTNGDAADVGVAGDFYSTAGAVLVDGALATATGITDNAFPTDDVFSVQVPPHLAGKALITVINADGQSASQYRRAPATEAFAYTQALAITFADHVVGAGGGPISVTSGPTIGGTSVVLRGHNIHGTTVTFGGAVATIVSFADSSFPTADVLTVRAPPHAGGATDIVVRNPDNQASTLVGGFVYLGVGSGPAPSLFAVSPANGPSLGGTSVNVFGSNFQDGAVVRFDTTAVATTFVSSGQVSATTPPHAPGVVTVTVTNPDAQVGTLPNGFTFDATPAPTIASVNPNQGSSNGGTSVTIMGSNFAPGATVLFDSTAATSVTVNSATSVTAVTPGHAAGLADVTVRNPDTQQSTLGDAFTYVAAPAPDAASITPITGPAGTGFTIAGSNFATTPGLKVLFGTTEATGVSVNGAGTSITGSVQGTVGLKDVTVRNPDGQEDTLTGAFTITVGTTTTGTGTTTGTTSQTITATQTSTPTTTTTATPTQTTTTTTGTGLPSASQIASCNDRMVVTVEHEEDVGNHVQFTVPSGCEPATGGGVQIHYRNSPWQHLIDLSVLSAAFRDGEYLHTGSNAQSTTEYLVSLYYAQTSAAGYFNPADADDVPNENLDGVAAESEGLPLWVWLLIFLGGLLLLILLIVIIVAATRDRDEEPDWAPTQSAAAWTAVEQPQEAPAWEEPAHAEDHHHIRCPNCDTRFTAVGSRPLVTHCPGCGKKGVLN